jgi:hypothetical protein
VLGFALPLLLIANSAFGAVAFNSAGSANGAGVGSISFALSTAGSDRALVGNAMAYDALDCAPSSMSYNSAALSNITSTSINDTTGTLRSNQRQLVAPSTGSNTFTVNYTNSGSNCYDQAASAVSLTGVDQTTPTGTAAVATGVSATATVNVTSATDEMVVDSLIYAANSASMSVGAGQTQRANLTGGNGFMFHGSSTEAGAATVTMSWTQTNSSYFALVATPFKPVSGGGGGSTIYNRLLMGVGF